MPTANLFLAVTSITGISNRDLEPVELDETQKQDQGALIHPPEHEEGHKRIPWAS